MEKENKPYSISPLTEQMCWMKLGVYCSERLSIDLYYASEVIKMLINEIGEENIRKELKDYDLIMAKFNKLDKSIMESKVFYDAIKDKVFDKKYGDDELPKIQRIILREFYRQSSRVKLIQQDFYKLFIFLIKRSTLHRQNIRAEYYKVLEYKDSNKVDLGRKRIERREFD